MAKYRLGVASLVHDHVWGELKHWAKLADVEIVAAGDVNEELRTKIRDQFGVAKLYGSWQEMLESEELDVVQAAAENSVGADIVEACAAKGIHVVSEKPMAARLAQAERMLKAAEAGGIRLMINWPSAWSQANHAFTELIEQGAIGEVFYLKYRAAHNGPREIGCSKYFWEWLYNEDLNGAGAFMDYCCYGSVMAAYFLGLPKRCIGFRSRLVKDYDIADDNGTILMHYEHALGVAEASWTQRSAAWEPNPIAYGSSGSVGVLNGKVILHQEGKEPKEIDPAPMPAGYSNGPEHFIQCLETGAEIRGTCNPIVSRNAQEILEAGLLSADRGEAVELPVG